MNSSPGVGAPIVQAPKCSESGQIELAGSEISMDVRCLLSHPHKAEHFTEVKMASGEIAKLFWKGRDPMQLDVSKDAITAFDGRYKFLDNGFPAEIEFEGLYFPTVAHAFSAARTVDMMERDTIRKAQKPGQARRLGDNVTLRPNWGNIMESVLLQLISKKFAYDGLAEALAETRPSDLVYGNKLGDRELGAELVDGQWLGRNLLGKILMKVRNEIR